MTIQLRRDTAANWASVNPVLASGQPGYDTTNKILKVGDGSTAWASLTGIGGGTGTVSTVSIATANGFAGSVADPTATPFITISTGVTGLLKGDGAAVSAAVAGTDYITPASKLSALAPTTSAELAGVITDETGTGSLVFGTSPNITTPTGIVKGDVGLGNVDDTSDVNKPISTATQTALDGKQPLSAALTNTTASFTTTLETKLNGIASGATANSSDATLLARANHTGTQLASTISDFNTAADARVVAVVTGKENTIAPGTTGQYWRGDKSWQTLDKTAVGLGNVANTSDANKPVSTAQQTALDLKANTASPTLVSPALGTPTALVGTNITGTASGLTAGKVTTNANLTGHVTSVGNAAVLGSFTSAHLLAALTDETGSGVSVFNTSPTFLTSVITTSASFTLFNTSATTITAFGAATTLNIGASTATATHNYSFGATLSGDTKTVNLGTAGASGSITNINIGSAVGGALGTTTLNQKVVLSNTLNNVTVTAPATAATLTLANNSSLVTNGGFSTTLTSTGTTSVTLPTSGKLATEAVSIINALIFG